MHYSKCVQHVPKAVYRYGCRVRDKLRNGLGLLELRLELAFGVRVIKMRVSVGG